MTTPYTVAELCAGYGGIHHTLRDHLQWPVQLAWYAENNPDATHVLHQHHPHIPNHGDITTINWTTIQPVDILTAGWPCQPYSLAGKRKGHTDERAIWPTIAHAIRILQPRLFLGENVPGILARGQLARTIGDLAHLGYVGSWLCVRASDIGAPHQRNRMFLAAHPDGVPLRIEPVPTPTRHHPAVASNHHQNTGHQPALFPTPNAALGRGTGTPSPTTAQDRRAAGKRFLDDAVALLPTPTASEWQGVGMATTAEGTPNLRTTIAQLLPTPTAADRSGAGISTTGGLELRNAVLLPTPIGRDHKGMGYTDREGRPLSETIMRLLPTPRATDGPKGGPNTAGDLMLPSAVQPGRYGQYTAAITRWEHTLHRPAPNPTQPGSRGQPRLNPQFVEWMMGLPEGWITHLIDPNRRPRPGTISRDAALRLLGNGVVPHQAAHAYHTLSHHLGMVE